MDDWKENLIEPFLGFNLVEINEDETLFNNFFQIIYYGPIM